MQPRGSSDSGPDQPLKTADRVRRIALGSHLLNTAGSSHQLVSHQGITRSGTTRTGHLLKRASLCQGRTLIVTHHYTSFRRHWHPFDPYVTGRPSQSVQETRSAFRHGS
jgi:hypothetical protein